MKSKTNRERQQQNNQFSVSELATITETVRQANEYSDKKLSDRFRDVSWIIVGVVIVIFIAFVQMIVNLFQINNAAYKDYTQRLEERNQFLDDYRQQMKVNNELLQFIASQSAEKK